MYIFDSLFESIFQNLFCTKIVFCKAFSFFHLFPQLFMIELCLDACNSFQKPLAHIALIFAGLFWQFNDKFEVPENHFIVSFEISSEC